jgi:hypothetical protein
MTKTIDYTKTIFYKIICNDKNIKDCYIGHTTNFIRRKSAHKCRCNNENDKQYNYNVYKFIRDNGGWCNWSMIIIEEIQFDNKLDALCQEKKYIEEYKAILNKVIPTRIKQEYKLSTRKRFYCDKFCKEYKNIIRDGNQRIMCDQCKTYFS